MTIKLENSHIIVRETHKSSRGGTYVYVVRDSKLMHISRFFIPSNKEHKDVVYKIPIQEAKAVLGQKVEFIEFGFSNKGNFFPWSFIVDFKTKTLTERSLKNCEIHRQYEFEIFGEEYHALKEYERNVPPLIERVWEIEKKLNLEVRIRGARSEEVHENPELAKFNSLVFPNPRGRAMSLKEKIRFAHELYVLMLVVDTMLNEPPEERTLWVSHKNYPTLVIANRTSPVTVWYQFSIEDWTKVVWGHSRELIEEVTKLIARGKYEEAEKLLGIKLPRTYAKAMKVLASLRSPKRIHVKPDIMIFKGEYHSMREISENPPDKAILIDAKIEMTQNDLKQLLEYRTKFPKTFENTEFIVAAIGGIPAHYRNKLERDGYRVIENVFPGKPGEKEFQETIGSIIETWKE